MLYMLLVPYTPHHWAHACMQINGRPIQGQLCNGVEDVKSFTIIDESFETIQISKSLWRVFMVNVAANSQGQANEVEWEDYQTLKIENFQWISFSVWLILPVSKVGPKMMNKSIFY